MAPCGFLSSWPLRCPSWSNPSVAVMVLAVGMASVGVLTDDQAIMSIYGSYLGTNATLLILSVRLSGVSRRIAMVQVFYNLLQIAIFVPLLYVEIWRAYH